MKTTEELAQEIAKTLQHRLHITEFNGDSIGWQQITTAILPILTAHEQERQKEVHDRLKLKTLMLKLWSEAMSKAFGVPENELRDVRDIHDAIVAMKKENADLRALMERMRESLLEVSAQDGCYCSPSTMIEVRECATAASAILTKPT